MNWTPQTMGRKGGKQKKNYSAQELERRAALLRLARLKRWAKRQNRTKN